MLQEPSRQSVNKADDGQEIHRRLTLKKGRPACASGSGNSGGGAASADSASATASSSAGGRGTECPDARASPRPKSADTKLRNSVRNMLNLLEGMSVDHSAGLFLVAKHAGKERSNEAKAALEEERGYPIGFDMQNTEVDWNRAGSHLLRSRKRLKAAMQHARNLQTMLASKQLRQLGGVQKSTSDRMKQS